VRTAKYMFWVVGLALAFIGCKTGEKPVSDAESTMKKSKQVRIATDPVYMPFSYGSGTGVQGLDIDIGNEIGKDLGFEVNWIKVSGYEHLFELLKKGDVELGISSCTIDRKRSGDFSFSDPYFDSGDAIARQVEKPEIKDLASLSGKKIGIQTGRSAEDYLAAQKIGANLIISKFPTLDDALGALNRTEIDAVIGDDPMLTYSIFKSFEKLETTGIRLNRFQYAVAVREADRTLLESVNRTLQRMKSSGALESLRDRWFQTVLEEAEKEREKNRQVRLLKKSPKTVTVQIVKSGGRTLDMDSLDGFQLVLEGKDGTYKSTSIRTEGSRGRCSFGQPVPPGDYQLNMIIFQKPQTVTIPELPKSAITLLINVAKDTTITPQ
jgi:ABC-type amino acid transport substrate-binding protein